MEWAYYDVGTSSELSSLVLEQYMKVIGKNHVLLVLLAMRSIGVFSQQDGLSAIQLRDSVGMYFQQKQFDRAQSCARTYLNLNPYDAELMYLSAQLAYHQKDWDTAIKGFKNTGKVGFNRASSYYNIACCYALDGQKKEAVDWLKKAIDEQPSFYYGWMEDSDLGQLADDKVVLEQLYDYDRKAVTRNDKWISDITFFDQRMEQFHYNLFDKIGEQQWENQLDKLKSDVEKLDDIQIIVRLMQLASQVGDGHTVLVPPVSGRYQFGLCPFLSYRFDDGLYVLETQKEYEHLLGGKILSIEGMPIAEVLQRIKTVVPSDNELGSMWLEPLALSIPEILYGLGIVEDKGAFELTYLKEDQEKCIKVKVNEQLTPDFLESWLYGFHHLVDWVELEQEVLPTSRTRMEESYWFEYLKEDELVVFHYNQVKTNPEENEAQFMKRLNEFIAGNPVRALVVDLRYNEGGDNTIYGPFLKGLIANPKINGEGKLFVLTGRRTFSAGMCFATALEQSTEAIFVGEPTGSSPNFVGESGGVFQLPYSGIYVNASNLFWQNSYAFDHRNYIAPDIYVAPKVSDYVEGRDAPLEAVRHFLKTY